MPIKRYHMNGPPTHCQNPRCMCEFVGACLHGPDNRYYCTRHCYDEAVSKNQAAMPSATLHRCF
jgi:hypothetical protein